MAVVTFCPAGSRSLIEEEQLLSTLGVGDNWKSELPSCTLTCSMGTSHEHACSLSEESTAPSKLSLAELATDETSPATEEIRFCAVPLASCKTTMVQTVCGSICRLHLLETAGL